MLSIRKKDRNINLDLIRFLGVLIIMIAHSSPPSWLFQLRNFGTPLLILGSALTYSFIYKYKSIDKISFLKKRVTRLIIPLWLFLTFFFLFFWIVSLIIQKKFPFSTMDLVNSFNLFRGIGFVWIFKVYIILALITPLGLKLSNSSISNKKYFFSIILIYLIYELGMNLFFNTIPYKFKDIISQYFLVIIPYSALYFYGLRLNRINDKNLFIIILFSLILFIVLALKKYIEFKTFIPTQNYKYPPTIYYLSYAFFCINLIYVLVSKYVKINKTKTTKLIIWLSSNSLWIYLWHIFAYYLWSFSIEGVLDIYFGTLVSFLIKMLYLLGFGIVMTYIQVTLVDKLLMKSNTITMKKAISFLK